jgi:DNA-directed RNA polymerase sigma subunit (sigma70/sigma32)
MMIWCRYLSEMGGFARLTRRRKSPWQRIEQAGGSASNRQAAKRPSSGGPKGRWRRRDTWTDGLGSDQARAHMIRANLRLVVGIARQFSGRGLALLDLVRRATSSS